MCSALNVYMFVYILILTHMVPLIRLLVNFIPDQSVKGVHLTTAKVF